MGRPTRSPSTPGSPRGDLSKAWTTTQQNNWSIANYNTPAGGYDTGTINSITSSTTVTITSASGTQTAAANYWSGLEAWLHLYKTGGTGLTYTESRPVTANTAESAGSSFGVTLGYPLDNSASGAYDSYALIGTASAPGTPGLNDVWRLYNVVNTAVSGSLVKSFPTNVPWFGYYGDGYAMTQTPEAVIVGPTGVTIPASFKIVPQTGQIRFDQPTVVEFNTPQNLALGGTHVSAPNDIYALLAYSRGALSSTYPSSGYSGTAYTLFGLQRTAYVDVDSWVYAGNASLFSAYAQMLHDSMCDAVFTGTVKVLGPLNTAFLPGVAVSITGTGYTTGQDTLAVPVRKFWLTYHVDVADGVLTSCDLSCSSRKNPATGDRYYVHPTTLEQLNFKLPFKGNGFRITVSGAGFGESQGGGI